ncbi:MAG: FUSC family protein [Blautia sp.]
MNGKGQKICSIIREKFRFSTLSFLFIIVYVNLFPLVLGPENSIVGVIFTIMMSASMVRDYTAAPWKHLLIQCLVLVWMALAAYWVNVLPAAASFLINFVTILVILYAFTYEYSSHMYFPYILSYLFLVFISPVDGAHMPRRLLGMLVGAVSILLYQWVMGRKRVSETAKDVLTQMTDEISEFIAYRLGDREEQPDLSDTRHKLCRISQTVFDRRKKAFCVSEAGFSMVDAGRGLESLLILLHELPEDLNQEKVQMLRKILVCLKEFRGFLQQETTSLPEIEEDAFLLVHEEKTGQLFYQTVAYIRDRLMHMTDPQNKTRFRKTALSIAVRLEAVLDFGTVRAVYAIRTALLLSCATLLVQLLGLPHGKWLLFTIASTSLPYADDVPLKIKKRVLATVIGGLAAVLIYSLIPSAVGRTAAMMLSGYLSFYFSDYTGTFACSTIGALGGAVFMTAFGTGAVSSMFLIRLCYILAGAAIAYLFNCLVLPYSRARATRQLWKKYKSITELLTAVCREEQPDTQLYYSLVLQAHMIEEKLSKNAVLEDWKELPGLLETCRSQVRLAHRRHIAERKDAVIFETGHLA